MRKIYLASDSKARKKLLNILGLKFKVLPSRLGKEKMSGRNYPGIVIANALLKAQDVSRRVDSGLIIAADTIVVQDNNIFGKPKDLKDARRMLKSLSRKPHWLYTGIVVVDKPPHQLSRRSKNNYNWCGGKNKTLVDFEKTKVYMDPLSDRQINNYFSRVSPLGLAGSFDIQGRGAFFIRRIEGCFYNVVGLPLRKLYLMLKQCGVKIFLLFAVCYASFVVSGCSTEYNLVTKEEESYMYSTDKEVAMGDSIARQIDKEYKTVEDPLVEDRVERIGKKIAAVCDRRDIVYHFKVIDEEDVNAVSLPGGYVYIFKGLIDRVANDDELAGVISHEVGHIVARHSIKKLQGNQAYSIFRVLAGVAGSQGGSGAGEVGAAADAAYTELMLGYSREDELLADQLGARYAKLAGYNPKAMITFLQKLDKYNKRRGPQPISYYKTHPYVPDRIRVVKQELGQNMNFNDYINIEQKTHE